MDEDNSAVLDVLANASDVDGDSLNIASFTQGTNGSIALDSQNKLIYTPNTHYSGNDSFDYTISDENNGTVTKTVNLTVNALPFNITGTDADDILTGNYKDNTIVGGIGADTMSGGLGNDTYYVDNINDVVNENEGEGTDLVYSSVDSTLGDNVENLTLIGINNINATGNDLDNVITGNSGNDTFDGGAGSDTLLGGNGDDTYLFNASSGSDIISDTNGADTVSLDPTVNKSDIGVFMSGTDLVIDYGTTIGQDKIVVLGQTNSDSAVEKIQLSDGTYISNTDVNQLIQTMTAYATNNSIQLTSVSDVKNNQDLMAMVASSWHN